MHAIHQLTKKKIAKSYNHLNTSKNLLMTFNTISNLKIHNKLRNKGSFLGMLRISVCACILIVVGVTVSVFQTLELCH